MSVERGVSGFANVFSLSTRFSVSYFWVESASVNVRVYILLRIFFSAEPVLVE